MFRQKQLTYVEVLAIAILLGFGWFISFNIADLYDIQNTPSQICLIGVNILVSVLLLTIGLHLAGLPWQASLPAALWGMMGWNAIHLAHLAYIGPLMIPLEIWVATQFIRLRSEVTFKRALFPVLIVRLAVILVTELLRGTAFHGMS